MTWWIGLRWMLGVWAGFTLLIGIHELGHAWAARRLGIGFESISIGVGPAVLRGQVGDVAVAVRAVPILGWVSLRREEVPLGSLRVAGVYAAGPAASAVGGVLLCAVSLGFGVGSLGVGADAVVSAATDVWSAPAIGVGVADDLLAPVLVRPDFVERPAHSAAAGSGLESGRGGGRGEGGDDGPAFDAAGRGRPRLVSVVGVVSAADQVLATYGWAGVVFGLGLVSMSLASLNLLPGYGLDGHGALEEVAVWLAERVGVPWWWASRAVGGLAVVVLASLVLALGHAVMFDLRAW